MYGIRQRFDDTRVKDIRERVRAEFAGLSGSAIQPGQRVAITAGSRGISGIAEILGTILEFLIMMAKLPFNEIDLLFIDEMGKDINGVGIDPNITGRNRDLLGVFPTRHRLNAFSCEI